MCPARRTPTNFPPSLSHSTNTLRSNRRLLRRLHHHLMTIKTLPIIIQPPPLSPFLNSQPLSWLLRNRHRRIIFLTLCCPILLPLICLSFPLICLAQLYTSLCRRRRHHHRAGPDDGGAGRLRRCEEGIGEGEEAEERELGWMLLQRYLEDQLGLVESVVDAYDCGRDGDDDDEIADLASGEISESNTPLLF